MIAYNHHLFFMQCHYVDLPYFAQESLSLQNEAAPQKTQAKPNKPSSNAKRSVSSAPKLRRTPNHVPDSSTDDVESPQPRARRPVKNKKTPSKSAQHKVGQLLT